MLVNKKLAFCTIGERIHLCNIILLQPQWSKELNRTENKQEGRWEWYWRTYLPNIIIVCDLNGILAKVFIFRFNKSWTFMYPSLRIFKFNSIAIWRKIRVLNNYKKGIKNQKKKKNSSKFLGWLHSRVLKILSRMAYILSRYH